MTELCVRSSSKSNRFIGLYYSFFAYSVKLTTCTFSRFHAYKKHKKCTFLVRVFRLENTLINNGFGMHRDFSVCAQQPSVHVRRHGLSWFLTGLLTHLSTRTKHCASEHDKQFQPVVRCLAKPTDTDAGVKRQIFVTEAVIRSACCHLCRARAGLEQQAHNCAVTLFCTTINWLTTTQRG